MVSNPSNNERLWLPLLAILSLSAGAHATALPAWDMETLTRASDAVIRGTVGPATQGELDGRLVTTTRIDVEQLLYRNEKRIEQPLGPSVTITQWGGHSRSVSTRVGGDAKLVAGETVLVFLFRGPAAMETKRPPRNDGRAHGPLLFITQLGIGVFVIDEAGDFVQVVDADLISMTDGHITPAPAERRFSIEQAVTQIEAGQHPPGQAPPPPVEVEAPEDGDDRTLLPLAEIQKAQDNARLSPRPKAPAALPKAP